jgi:hypothetical protein
VFGFMSGVKIYFMRAGFGFASRPESTYLFSPKKQKQKMDASYH